MSSEPRDRASMLSALEQEMGRLSAQEGAYRQALAERLGLNPTDLRCVELLVQRGALGAGQLAEALGLTTGAITGVVDRLERGGWARRARSESDRRAVILELVPERKEEIEAQLSAPGRALAARVEDLSVKELARVVEFVEGSATWLEEAAATLRGQAQPTPGGAEGFSAALGQLQRARLEFATGASGVHLSGDRKLAALYLAQFEGRPPNARVEDGTVTIRYPRFSMFDWRKLAARVALNVAIPWELAFRGGLSRMEADLRQLELTSLEVTGGASDVMVSLPRPRGVVPIRISGGASQLILKRPRGSALRLEVRGGLSKLTFDAQHVGAVGGRLRLESPQASDADDRYDLELTGGASNLTVVEQ